MLSQPNYAIIEQLQYSINIMPKTNKSIIKRMRITKTGKIMRMPGGINHFQAKKSRNKQTAKGMTQMSKRQSEMVIAYLKH